MKNLFILSMLSAILLSACNTPIIENAETEQPPVETQTTTETGDEAENANTEENVADTKMSATQDPQYIAYSEATYNELLGQKPFALFFHAPWCSVCVGMEADINKNLSTLPKGTVILKADFDSQTELKKKYGITTQSTIVIVDKDGKALKTLAAPDSQELSKEISVTL